MKMWKCIDTAIVLQVEGRDARRYLHNRLSNSIRDLTVGSAIEAAALSAKGRVEAFFAVYCQDEDRFLLIADGGDVEQIRASLMRFVVADRVVCSDLTSSSFLAHVSSPSLTTLSPTVSFPRVRIAGGGVDALWLDCQPESVRNEVEAQYGSEISNSEYFAARWKQGAPMFPEELNEAVVLTECGMRHAVSFTKGCYVGQEVMERSDAIGKLPRKLERISCAGPGVTTSHPPLAIGSVVKSKDGATIGKTISFGRDERGDDILVFALLSTGKYAQGEEVLCEGLSGIVV